MPLETIGSYAVAGSSGAIARGARTVDSKYSPSADDLSGFSAFLARDDDAANSVIAIPSPSPNLAAYLSPFIRLDLVTRLAIVEIRNSDTGEVQQQYPSPRAVREYQQNQIDASELAALTEEDDYRAEAPQTPQVVTFGTPKGTGTINTGNALPVAEAAQAVPVPGLPSGTAPSAALAAFSSVQNALTGSRQLAVA
ncbi:hypothetical protein [Ferrovibrio sp.]|uniref:hypothetical protein n=1 Tax=Ferrovibrio sp. TaxID=1917215 RepID=UPI0026033922|nr:hypothetical protein [Ferrovibrio sp.]